MIIPTPTTTTYSASFNGSSMKRIRTPHEHDVLSGRGGGINGHAGNVRFREWVRVRKNDYNLAQSKVAKAQVAKEVIALVQDQNPPGRFLQKDPNSIGQGWWVELDEDKVIAKTSQALREGAPQIRAAHREELEELRSKTGRRSRKTTKPVPPMTATPHAPQISVNRSTDTSTPELAAVPRWTSFPVPAEKVVEQLRANALAAKHAFEMEESLQSSNAIVSSLPSEMERPNKRVRVDYNGTSVRPTDDTPPLLPLRDTSFGPSDNIVLPPPAPFGILPPPRLFSDKGVFPRANSLALSELSLGEIDSDFVNPFAEENEVRRDSFSFPPRINSLTRDISQTSDISGIDMLFRSDAIRSSGSNSSGVRSRNNSSNVNSRSPTSVHSDLPVSTTVSLPETDYLKEKKAMDAYPSWEDETFSSSMHQYASFNNQHQRLPSKQYALHGLYDGRQ